MACDIIATVAWSCDETDGCTSPGGWHMSNYWLDDEVETGYTEDRYADGDHEYIEEKDLPTPEDVTRSWTEYAEWVAENGLDPLGNYMVPKDVTTQTRHYTVTLRDSLLGVFVWRLRRNGRTLPLDHIEQTPEVRDWLGARRDGPFGVGWTLEDTQLPDGLRLADLAATNNRKVRNHQLVIPFSVEVTRPDAAARTSRWLITKASE